jgi:hypothetical protein
MSVRRIGSLPSGEQTFSTEVGQNLALRLPELRLFEPNRPPEKGAEGNSTNARRTQDVRFGTKAAQTKLLRLLERHRAEWSAFVNSLPERSWVGDIVARL